MRASWRLVLVSMLALTGCPHHAAPDAGAPGASIAEPDAGADAGPAADAGVDGGVDGGAILPFTAELLLNDGGTDLLPAGDRVEIDPVAGLTLHFATELKDFRVRMIDGADQVVPSDDESRATDGGTDYQVHFLKPLRPAHTYHLQIDAQSAAEITDVHGRTFQDVDLQLKTLGEPEPAPGKKPKRRHH